MGNLLEIAINKKQLIRISSEVAVWISHNCSFKWLILSICDPFVILLCKEETFGTEFVVWYVWFAENNRKMKPSLQWARTAAKEAEQCDTFLNHQLKANPSACKKCEKWPVMASWQEKVLLACDCTVSQGWPCRPATWAGPYWLSTSRVLLFQTAAGLNVCLQ